MKILHAAETIKGGVATVVRQIVTGQIQDNSNVVKCIAPSEQLSELYSIADDNILSFSRTGRNLRSFLNFFFLFIKTVYKFNPDLVHLHSTFSGVLGRIGLIILLPVRRPKVVYCPHAFSFMMRGNIKKMKLFALLERLFSPATDAIICVSQHEKDSAIKFGLPKRKLKVVHNGVPDVIFKPGLVSPYKNEAVNVLFVGRFDYQKGFDILLDAMKLLEGKPIFLTAVGSAVHSF